MSKCAVFITDNDGREKLAIFQQSNLIISASGGEIIIDDKKVPAVWITYLPPATNEEIIPENNGKPTNKTKRKKPA